MKTDERVRLVVKTTNEFKKYIKFYCIDNYISIQDLINKCVQNILIKGISIEIEHKETENKTGLVYRLMPEQKKELKKISKILEISMSEIVVQELQDMLFKKGGNYV